MLARLSVGLFCAGLSLWTLACTAADEKDRTEGKLRVYIGTNPGGGSKGIYTAVLDLRSGSLSAAELAGPVTNPSFLALHTERPLLYAVSEISDPAGKKTGGVAAFAVESSGRLNPLNSQPSGGTGPSHVSLDRSGKTVLVANYGSGSVAALPILEDGSLGEAASVIQHEGRSVHPERQQGPHAHSINVDLANRFAIAADLGIDKLLVYRLDANLAKLVPNKPAFFSVAAGAGPRHFAFHPDGPRVFVINELTSTITALRYEPEGGTLEEIHTVSTLPAGFDGVNTTAEVQVHPSGRFLYGSNRGHDSIAMFSIDADSGRLTSLGQVSSGGKTPRNFGLDPTGQFLVAANQLSDNIVVFRIDQQTGKLTRIGDEVKISRPVCIKFRRMD